MTRRRQLAPMMYSKRFTRRSFLAGLGASTAMLIAACSQTTTAPAAGTTPAAGAASSGSSAAPAAGGPMKDVARKDTLVHTVAGTEIPEATNFSPYSIGGLGRIR